MEPCGEPACEILNESQVDVNGQEDVTSISEALKNNIFLDCWVDFWICGLDICFVMLSLGFRSYLFVFRFSKSF